jgi:hypothetical protein
MKDIILKNLELLLDKEIELDGYKPNSQKTKIVSIAINQEEDNFYIGVLPVDGAYEGCTPQESSEGGDECVYLNEYANTNVFWIDKDMVENIKDLKHLIDLKEYIENQVE